jgi:ABC-type amino acid transport system permease subunit
MFKNLTRFLKDTKAQAEMSTMDIVIATAIGLLILVAVFQMAPMLGNSIDGATDVAAGSPWNTSENEDIPTGVSVWSENASLLLLVVLVSLLGLAILIIRGLQ